MKLIIAGPGFLGTEIIRQALAHPRVSSVVVIGRRAVDATAFSAGAGKLQSVVIEDLGSAYPADAAAHFADADACIWTIAVTPRKSAGLEHADVKRVCHDYTLLGLRTMIAARNGQPFRVCYTSGAMAERDQTKTPTMMPEHVLMRGQTENEVLTLGGADVCVAKPGFIYTPENDAQYRALLAQTGREIPGIHLDVCAAAMLQQTLDGFEKEPLLNEDLERLGRRALETTA